MRIISAQLNYSAEKERYRLLGNLMLAQKLLNDYLSVVNIDGIDPEGYAEGWMENFGVDTVARAEVLNMFVGEL